jgi:N-carbamoylputrescine amidase
MQGHAAANCLPLVASNRIGTEKGKSGEMTFYGSSFISDATGGIVGELNRGEEGVVVNTFDLDEVARLRASWGLFRDRRPDLYDALCGHDGE